MFSLGPHPCESVTDQKAIKADGILVGYCSVIPGKDVGLLCKFSEYDVSQIRTLITNEIGQPGAINWGRLAEPFRRYRNGIEQNRLNDLNAKRDKARRDRRKRVSHSKPDRSRTSDVGS